MFIVVQLQPVWATIGLGSKWFLWPAVAWLVWYVFAARRKSAEATILPATVRPAPVA
jgi:hypothetical protein